MSRVVLFAKILTLFTSIHLQLVVRAILKYGKLFYFRMFMLEYRLAQYYNQILF